MSASEIECECYAALRLLSDRNAHTVCMYEMANDQHNTGAEYKI